MGNSIPNRLITLGGVDVIQNLQIKKQIKGKNYIHRIAMFGEAHGDDTPTPWLINFINTISEKYIVNLFVEMTPSTRVLAVADRQHKRSRISAGGVLNYWKKKINRGKLKEKNLRVHNIDIRSRSIIKHSPLIYCTSHRNKLRLDSEPNIDQKIVTALKEFTPGDVVYICTGMKSTDAKSLEVLQAKYRTATASLTDCVTIEFYERLRQLFYNCMQNSEDYLPFNFKELALIWILRNPNILWENLMDFYTVLRMFSNTVDNSRLATQKTIRSVYICGASHVDNITSLLRDFFPRVRIRKIGHQPHTITFNPYEFMGSV